MIFLSCFNLELIREINTIFDDSMAYLAERSISCI